MGAPAAPSLDRSSSAAASAGRLILVVGPSGAGKDTLIDAARTRLAGDAGFVFPRRVVTRAASPAEDNRFVDEAGFRAIEADDGFALAWRAHGHAYGIPAAILADLAGGRTVVVNVSRTVVAEARRRWPLTRVVEVTAPAAVLARRIAARGRASDGVSGDRLDRRLAAAPASADLVIDNGGALDAAVAAFLAALREPTEAAVSKPRYAIYLAPAADTELWRLASRVIGRDAVGGELLPFPRTAPCDAPDWFDLTEEPRRYGFHATLKAPFELVDGTDETLLVEAAAAFAEGRSRFVVADLAVRTISGFVALTPETRNADLDRLAADCVVAFEPFRAPLSAEERARRVKGLADPAEIAAVDRWGYPFVFEHFRFHMTLTGRLPEERRGAVVAALADLVGPAARPLLVDAITVFRQDERTAPFRIVARLPFSG